MLGTSPRPSSASDPWQWLVGPPRADGLEVRVARTLADAEAVRALIGDGWPVTHAQDLYERVIAPSQATTDIHKLDALCLLVEARGPGRRAEGPIGTFSVVFDHHARILEVGRGATAKGWRDQDLAASALAPLLRVFAVLPTYAVAGDVTTLSRGAARAARGLEMRVVALHPSNASVPAKDVDGWHTRLGERHGKDLAELLVRRSPTTGLGRFMTCHHVRRPTSFAPYQPSLTPRQQPFFAHTCRVLDLDLQTPRAPQRSRLRSMTIRDRSHTATRTLINPPRALDVPACVETAAREGVETLVIQVPCDPQHLGISERLEQAGAILGGVIVGPRGYWRASYTLATSTAHAVQLHEDLAQLAASSVFEGPMRMLLRLVSHTATARLERAS